MQTGSLQTDNTPIWCEQEGAPEKANTVFN